MSPTVVLITGANQGLGFECVKKLAAEQPDYHILLGSRNAQRGTDAAAKVTDLAPGSKVEPIQLDVTDDESIAKAAKYVEQKFGRLDVLFNNAGISKSPGKSFRDEMNEIYNTNTTSAACVTEAFLPLLKKAPVPRLVFMSSGLASAANTLDTALPFYGWIFKAYSASKAAMNNLGLSYAVLHGKEGFKVNMIDPGYRSTNINGFSETGGRAEEGALQACKIIVDTDKDGPHATFTSIEGTVPW
ncbi:hypothetical protein PV08_11913 [Exophiala spinifera]|uniref:Short chain dehydrogenase n=1 Tax=Exophiala spinifera TaxID=91928 RepID=A0A0D1Z9W9_9EURO|nr:uncharacterized protein PV08_11913 [Exophiala spinifera]KIW09812.1 hypothetical protein PV08_11913 [Exophiala spinifera]